MADSTVATLGQSAGSGQTSMLSYALTFSHLHSGLPFDFSLQQGLVNMKATEPAVPSRGAVPPTAATFRRLQQQRGLQEQGAASWLRPHEWRRYRAQQRLRLRLRGAHSQRKREADQSMVQKLIDEADGSYGEGTDLAGADLADRTGSGVNVLAVTPGFVPSTGAYAHHGG